jgi:hypothetical protein
MLDGLPLGQKGEILAVVNGHKIGENDLRPDLVPRDRGSLSEEEICRALEDYINDTLIVEQAIQQGLAETQWFRNRVQGFANKLNAEGEALTYEEKESILRNAGRNVLKQRILAGQDFKREHVRPEEVAAAYKERVEEYEWLKERLRQQGMDSQDRIEAIVMEQVRNDLDAPLRAEYRRQVDSYLQALRKAARIEYLISEETTQENN